MKVALVLPLLTCAAIATPVSIHDTAQSPFGAITAAKYPGFDLDLDALRLVQFEGQTEPVLVTELAKIQAKAQGVAFFDVTDTLGLGSRAHLRDAQKTFPAPRHPDGVHSVLENLEIQNLRENLEKFTSFRNRYYRSDTGKASQKWLLGKIKEITRNSASKTLRDVISIQEFLHPWPQSSIIARINGSLTADDGVIIISAHQDSTNKWPYLPAPGADDDGSGTMSILEAYRALIASDFHPERAVEFHWYAAEEGGLLGSQAVAQAYEDCDVNVVATIQFDMTAWVKNGTREEVGIITDFVDPVLTEYNKKLVELYLDIPWVATKCGFACSDHASWTKAGYPASSLIESQWENNNREHAHTTHDRYDVSEEFSFSHMLEFSKLAVAFAVELGGWQR
ncbi:peptidase [Trametes coccinea BRFM310]|uniref:Peptide hydrolase n=1 Tax=Trametes coccinea (strain BRFM310) TaxID=1353009 RepID=A0A1Y2IJQ1_TRAC3|nr:peptidase [Trametes coccinea BRFM310]